MSIDLQIRVDTSQTETAGTRGAAAVAKVEDAADRARDAMGRFAKTGAEAGTQVAAGAEKASESLNDLVDKLGGATDATEKFGGATDEAVGFTARHLIILERIKGPIKEHQADIAALNELQALGALSVKEYEAELVRLEQRYGSSGRAESILAQNLQREAAVFERIRGPMQRYEADVAALDRLMQAGTITAIEYENEFTKLAKQYGTIHGPTAPGPRPAQKPEPVASSDPSAALSSALGAGGALLGGGAIGAAIVGLGHSIQSLVDKYHEVEDAAINAGNSALKFADASHTVNQVIDEQIALAHDLHSNFTATIDLYDAVRDGTDELNVSHADQLRLTRSLGEEIQIAGKSMEQASGLVARFSYALAAGKIETRELKGIMREVPDIADTWTKHFGTSRQGLLELVKDGKVGTEDLMRALIDEGVAIDKNFEKRQRTNKQKEEEWILNEKLLSQRFDVSIGQGHNAQAAVDAFVAQAKASPEGLQRVQAVADTNSLAAWGNDNVKFAQAALEKIRADNKTTVDEFIDNISNLTGPFQKIGDAYRKYIGDTAEVRAEVSKLNDPISSARAELEVLNKAYSIGKIDLEEYTKRWQELQTVVGHGIGSQALKIAEPVRQAKQELTKLLDEIEAGANVSQAQFRKAFAGYQATINGGVLPEELKLKNPVLDAKDALADLNKANAEGKVSAAAFRREYEALVTTINDGRLPEAIKIWNAIHDPIDQARRDLAALNSLYRQGSLDTRDYVEELKKIAAAGKSSDATIIAGGIERFDALLANGTITLRDYNAQLNKVLEALRGSDRIIGGTRVRVGFDLNPHALPSTREADTAAASSAVQKAFADARAQTDAFQESGTGAAQALEQLRKNMDLGNQFVAPLVAYEQKIKDIDSALHANSLTQQQATFLQRQARDEYDKAEESLGRVKTPLDEYREAVRHLGEQLESGALSAAKYNDAVGEARVKLLEATGASRTFAGGMEIEWQKLKNEADNAGASIAKMAVDDIGKLSDALVTMANGGEVSFSAMVDSMIQDLEKLALRMLEIKLIEAGLNALFPGKGSAGVASGLVSGVVDSAGAVPVPDAISSAARIAPTIPAAAYSAPVTATASQSVSAPQSQAPTFVIVNQLSDSAVLPVLASRAGQRVFANQMRRQNGR